MACILKTMTKKGVERWLMTLQVKKVRFRLTFDTKDQACKWAEENEEAFVKNPEKYFSWKKELGYRMCRTEIEEGHGIRRPKIKKV